MDHATMSAAFAGPGQDTRQWASYGIVEPGEKSVIFTDEDGNVLPTGPLVVCTLQPSGITVPCRVASTCAGNDEADWFPFMPGDEVLVIVPEGDERAGCVIIGRLNQEIDKFPLTVAGQDVTKNTFGFKRLRTPYVIETASSFMIRSAITGAGLTIDQTGNAYFVSGDGHKLVLHGSFLQFGDASGDNFIQVDPTASEVLLQAGGTTQFAMGAGSSTFFTKGTLDIGTGGTAGPGHAITFEQIVGLLINFLVFLQAEGDISTWTSGGKIFFPATFPTVLDTKIAAWLNLAALPAPPTPASAGSNFTTLPLTYAPVTGAVRTALLANPLPDITGFIPGVGRPNLTF